MEIIWQAKIDVKNYKYNMYITIVLMGRIRLC